MAEAIGILGGTFDPVHFGHVRPALDVVEQLGLSHLHLIPNAVPPHRPQPIATSQQRLMMLHLAVKNTPQLIVDDREIQRDGESYTVDTLLSLRQDYPDNPLYLLMGSDAFIHIQTWHRWQEILPLAHIVVMQRPDEDVAMSEQLTEWYTENLAQTDDQQNVSGKIWPIEVTQLTLSSTDIRAKMSQGLTPHFLIPDSVIQLIEQLKLYQTE